MTKCAVNSGPGWNKSSLFVYRSRGPKGKVITHGGGGGEATRLKVGTSQVLPLEKGGGGMEKLLAALKGEHEKFWGSFNATLEI